LARRQHFVDRADFHSDFLQLDSFYRAAAASAELHRYLAEAILDRSQGDIDISDVGPALAFRVRGLAGQGLCRGAAVLGADDTHYAIIIGLEFYVLSQRIVKEEKLSDHLLVNNADTLLVVQIYAGEKPSHLYVRRCYLRVPRHGSDYLDSNLAISIPGLLLDKTARHDHFDIRYAVAKTLGVGISQAVFAHALVLTADSLFFGWLYSLDNNILAAEPGDLCLRLLTGAFADGKHRDDRGYAENNSQCRQAGTQLVHPQAFEA